MRGLHSLESRRRLAPISDLDVLRSRGTAAALVADGEVVDYRQLADRVEQRAREFGDVRRVVGLRGDNSIEFVVTYLAALVSGHVVAVGSSDVDPADCDLDVLARSGAPAALRERRPGTTHVLHPDLAALMGTSGSAGASKLVRLSKSNIDSNAMAIAEFLELGPDDRAITSLPLHYCYGLSVVTSHLAVGASVVLTDTSVVDPCFWNLVDEHAVTTLAGVPFTFELIDRLSTDALAARSLRRVTQAGGRLAPEQVTRLTRLGQRHAWDFVVMYGQTEATARMTHLPSGLTEAYPHSIGRPIPGGSIVLVPVDADALPAELADEMWAGDVGEIVYRGPNVMLGYAESPADFARGRDSDVLHTGDVARRIRTDGDGDLYEIVGRRSRFVKPFGQRIDLDHLGSLLRTAGYAAEVTGTDDLLVVAVPGSPDAAAVAAVRALVVGRVQLPGGAVAVLAVDEVPRLANGKVDHQTLIARALDGRRSRGGERPTSVAAVFATVLGVDDVATTDTFSSLGGDSLSYVEVSIRIEQILDALPEGWHMMTVSELDSIALTRPRASTRRGTQVETTVVIRAVGIALIVCTHMHVLRVPGGAHTLLAVAGYNWARFQLASADRPGHVRRGLKTVSRVAVPTSMWIGLQMLVAGGYSLGSLFLVNNYFGSPWRRDGRWEYWYFEAFVQILLVLTVMFAIPAVRRLERRGPFTFAFVTLCATAAVGLGVIELSDSYNAIYRSHTVVWFLLLGWCAHVATGPVQRILTTAVVVGATPIYFDRWQRAAVVILLVGLLIWGPRLRLPRRLAIVTGSVASASMVIFLIHWQVWPVYTSVLHRSVAYALTIATGVVVWAVGRHVARRDVVRHLLSRSRRQPSLTPSRRPRGRPRASRGSPRSLGRWSPRGSSGSPSSAPARWCR